ncbi:hypothetical protein Tco_1489879 [Tanacetum coccineum]
MELVLEQTQQGTSYEVSVSAEGDEELKRIVRIKGEKKESLHTLRQKPGQYINCQNTKFDESDTHVLERLNTSAGNPVKEILLKLNLPDHRILKDGGEVKEFQRSLCHSDTECISRSDEVLKLKNFKKDATLKLFEITYQERYEHVGLNVASSQDGKMRLCLVDDLKVFKITFSHSRQDKGTSSSLKSTITTSIHKLIIKVKDCDLKTTVEAYYAKFKVFVNWSDLP